MNASTAFKNIIDKHISLGNIIIIVFILGGFWYVTPQSIANNREDIEQNKERIETLQNQIQQNALMVETMQGRYITSDDLDDYVRVPVLRDLKTLMREIQSTQSDRLDRVDQRLDYIIQRLDQ